jgi:hypothetical protein
LTANWNEGSTRFVWTRTADEILARVVRKDREDQRIATAAITATLPARGLGTRDYCGLPRLARHEHTQFDADVRASQTNGAWMVVVPGRVNLLATTEDPMEQDGSVMTHPKFRMWLRPDGIVHVVWAPRTTPLLQDAIATQEAMAKVTGGRRAPLVVDMRDTGPQDRQTRAEWARPTGLLSAVALIVGSPLSRIMGNLFLRMNKPAFPVQLFDNEESAIAWLKGFVG